MLKVNLDGKDSVENYAALFVSPKSTISSRSSTFSASNRKSATFWSALEDTPVSPQETGSVPGSRRSSLTASSAVKSAIVNLSTPGVDTSLSSPVGAGAGPESRKSILIASSALKNLSTPGVESSPAGAGAGADAGAGTDEFPRKNTTPSPVGNGNRRDSLPSVSASGRSISISLVRERTGGRSVPSSARTGRGKVDLDPQLIDLSPTQLEAMHQRAALEGTFVGVPPLSLDDEDLPPIAAKFSTAKKPNGSRSVQRADEDDDEKENENDAKKPNGSRSVQRADEDDDEKEKENDALDVEDEGSKRKSNPVVQALDVEDEGGKRKSNPVVEDEDNRKQADQADQADQDDQDDQGTQAGQTAQSEHAEFPKKRRTDVSPPGDTHSAVVAGTGKKAPIERSRRAGDGEGENEAAVNVGGEEEREMSEGKRQRRSPRLGSEIVSNPSSATPLPALPQTPSNQDNQGQQQGQRESSPPEFQSVPISPNVTLPLPLSGPSPRRAAAPSPSPRVRTGAWSGTNGYPRPPVVARDDREAGGPWVSPAFPSLHPSVPRVGTTPLSTISPAPALYSPSRQPNAGGSSSAKSTPLSRSARSDNQASGLRDSAGSSRSGRKSARTSPGQNDNNTFNNNTNSQAASGPVQRVASSKKDQPSQRRRQADDNEDSMEDSAYTVFVALMVMAMVVGAVLYAVPSAVTAFFYFALGLLALYLLLWICYLVNRYFYHRDD